MELSRALLIDAIAISLVAGIYLARHRRRDLFLAFIAVNTGVFAVTVVLTQSAASAGLGLGLFGILSIIRLRSDAITQGEIAYYFTALTLGLVCGIQPNPWWISPALGAGLVLMVYLIDHPALGSAARRERVVLDRAVTSDCELRVLLSERLGGVVDRMIVLEVDFVQDRTVVDVRFRMSDEVARTASLLRSDR